MPQKIEGNMNFFFLVKLWIYFISFIILGKNEIAVCSAVSREFEEHIPLISRYLFKGVIR